MANFPRYAIYYAAAPGSELGRFGANLLGYDAWRGEDIPFPDGVAERIPDWRDLTQDPRKYGFHATLKAPLALAEGKTEAELVTACTGFADTPRAIPIIKPVVDAISGFIAVIPAQRSAELERLAGDCVSAFDPFRAPLTPEDRARRNPSRLTPRQRDYLDRWGYPYVMEGIPLPYDTDRPARRYAARAHPRDAAPSLRSNRHRTACDRCDRAVPPGQHNLPLPHPRSLEAAGCTVIPPSKQGPNILPAAVFRAA